MILPDWTAYLIIFWSMFLFVWNILLILYWNPRRTRKLISDLWNDPIELKDLDGQLLKVPVHKVIKNAKGEEEVRTDWIVGPLWYSVSWALANIATEKLKMSAMSAKGKIARQLNEAGFLGELKEAGIDAATALLIESLPAKARPIALLVARALKGTGTTQGGRQEAGQTPRRWED